MLSGTQQSRAVPLSALCLLIVVTDAANESSYSGWTLKVGFQTKGRDIQIRQSISPLNLRSGKLSIKETNPTSYQFDSTQQDLQEQVWFKRLLCRVNQASSRSGSQKSMLELGYISKIDNDLDALRIPWKAGQGAGGGNLEGEGKRRWMHSDIETMF